MAAFGGHQLRSAKLTQSLSFGSVEIGFLQADTSLPPSLATSTPAAAILPFAGPPAAASASSSRRPFFPEVRRSHLSRDAFRGSPSTRVRVSRSASEGEERRGSEKERGERVCVCFVSCRGPRGPRPGPGFGRLGRQLPVRASRNGSHRSGGAGRKLQQHRVPGRQRRRRRAHAESQSSRPGFQGSYAPSRLLVERKTPKQSVSLCLRREREREAKKREKKESDSAPTEGRKDKKERERERERVSICALN